MQIRSDALGLHHLGKRLGSLGVPLVPAVLRKLNLLLYSSFLPESAELGEGTVLSHGGIGVFIHGRAKVGRRCVISQFVSLGDRGGAQDGPCIGDYVRIGVGAHIVGPVRIGDFAVIGANTVVTKDVPAGAVVFGVPGCVVGILVNPVAEYERETGLWVAEEDRRGPRPKPTASGASPVPAANRVVTSTPSLFDTKPAPPAVKAPAEAPRTELDHDSP